MNPTDPTNPANPAPEPQAPPQKGPNLLRRLVGMVLPALVIGALGAFVYYSIYLYRPSEHLVCAKSVAAQQTDIAVHVVRQWFGKEGQAYAGCQESGQ